MTPIRLIAADMDGTLLDSRSRLPAGIFPMIRELTGQGIRFVIASGRQYYNLESLFRPVADRLTFVAENGAAVFEKGELLFYDEMRKEDVRSLIAESTALPGAVPGLCGVLATYIEREDPALEEQVRLYYDRLEHVEDLYGVPGKDRICKVTIYVPGSAEEAVYPALCARYPTLKVTLSVGENKLVFNRAESNNEARGYFKAVEASNTIKVELEGSYNKSPGDAAPVYVPVKWTREITDCKAGQWRKISIKILNATQGNIQFQMTVENWVYDQKIDVDVMQLFAFAGEETIPDEDLSDPNSPVVTLDGRDIAQGYTISKSMFDEELGKWSENLKTVITPQADASVRTAKLVFSSDNAELLAALDGAGYVNGTIPVWPQNDDLLAYLVMKEAASTHILAGTVKDAGMSGLFGYKGTHKGKFVVTDTKGRTSYTNLTVKVTEGGSVGTGPEVKWTNKAGTVSYDFGTRYKITKLSDSEADPEVKITVTSQTGIVGFSVDINSTTLTPEELQGLGLSTHMDLVNPGSFEGPLTNLGFPTGSAVAGKKSLTFDTSSFMPMLTVLGPGNSDFKLTVIDASGSVSKTIQLYVP